MNEQELRRIVDPSGLNRDVDVAELVRKAVEPRTALSLTTRKVERGWWQQDGYGIKNVFTACTDQVNDDRWTHVLITHTCCNCGDVKTTRLTRQEYEATHAAVAKAVAERFDSAWSIEEAVEEELKKAGL